MPGRITIDDRLDSSTPADPVDVRDDMRTFVTISRNHPTDVKQRQVVARLDDGTRTTLFYGDSITLEVAPGTHRLRAHNTLIWRTVKFTVEAGEHLEFILINRGPAWTYAMLALLGAAPLFLKIERRSLR
jgi:hypothetical protein